MKMLNSDHEILRRELYRLRNAAKDKDPFRYNYWNKLIELLESGNEENAAMIEAAWQGYLRNSEFPGDWVGRPDDDFDDDWFYH